MAKKPEAAPEQDSEQDQDEAAASAAGAGKKKKLIILGAVVALLLIVAGVGTWLALGALGGDEVEAVAGEEQATDAHAETEEVKPGKTPAIYEVLEPPFLTNYTVQGRSRYLQLSIALMAREQAGIDAAKTHMPVIRNRIVLLLSGEDFAMLQTDNGRQQLQQKVLAAVQEILQKEIGAPGIEQVYFTAMVMQ